MKETIDELKRLRSILSGITGFEDDDQEYIEDARKSVDRIIEELAKQPAQSSKPWVGLTPDDIRGLCANTIPSTWDISLCRLVEKFLKEKNT